MANRVKISYFSILRQVPAKANPSRRKDVPRTGAAPTVQGSSKIHSVPPRRASP